MLVRRLSYVLLACVPLCARAQQSTAPVPPTPSMEQRMQDLERRQRELEEELKRKDAEIQQMKNSPAKPAEGGAAVPNPPPAGAGKAIPDPLPAADVAGEPDPEEGIPPLEAPAVAATAVSGQGGAQAPTAKWGTYTPNFGFKVVDTDKGDMSISIYSYVRYLNQKSLDPSYTNAFGDTLPVKQRQDVQIQKVQIKFLGWLWDPKFRYFLYAWTSNTSQGQGAQVVLAGNLNYTFNKYFTLSGGITALPGVRSTEGQFPFWLSVDNRLMADEFFRPSYTSGIWARGDITDTLRYNVMIGNNMSTLGVSAAQLDNHLDTVTAALVWEPTKNYGIGFGDFEWHENLSTRFGAHFTHSTEDKQSQPNSDVFENTQIRLSDGTVVFTPNVFGPDTTVEQLQVFIEDLDFGLKYRGWSLEGEVYVRQLDHFEGPNTSTLSKIDNHGFSLWLADMVVPKTFQVYLGGSKIYGSYGNQVEGRAGFNVFPFKNKVLRWNTQVIYLDRAPTGGTAYTYPVGAKGFVFNTDLELAL
jgi:hypothetical protein